MSEPNIETEPQRLLRARTRLLHVLRDIAQDAAAQSLTRCPYRTREDVCTFRAACRNQIIVPHSPRRCAGGVLDARPASAAEIAAANADVDVNDVAHGSLS